MEIRRLGTSSISVSATGLGCNNLGRAGTASETPDGAKAVVNAAIDHGITLFDTADVYGREFGLSERLLGQAIAGRRDQVIVATKFGHDELAPDLAGTAAKGSRAYIRAAVEGSLERLGIDTIDLYQQHTPDPTTPIEETLAALDELVREGKVREIGCSNYDATRLDAADRAAMASGTARFVSVQNEYSLLERDAEDEVLPAAERLGIGFLPYFPLANGLFTGKFSRTERPTDSRIARQRPHIADTADWDAMEAYAAFCDAREIGMLDATFGWLLALSQVSSVIAGATRVEQVAQNAAAGDRWRPTPSERATISSFFPR